jgi:hypothetical protein
MLCVASVPFTTSTTLVTSDASPPLCMQPPPQQITQSECAAAAAEEEEAEYSRASGAYGAGRDGEVEDQLLGAREAPPRVGVALAALQAGLGEDLRATGAAERGEEEDVEGGGGEMGARRSHGGGCRAARERAGPSGALNFGTARARWRGVSFASHGYGPMGLG